MQFNVPQFIDIEDHIVGPLTAKQLGWLAMGGVIVLVLWSLLDFSAFILGAVIVGVLSVLMAFFKPYGLPMFHFVKASLFFIFRPKVYIWKRKAEKIKLAKTTKKINPRNSLKTTPKVVTKSRIENISQILDR